MKMKRLLAFLLVVLTVCSVLPLSVFAAEGEAEETETVDPSVLVSTDFGNAEAPIYTAGGITVDTSPTITDGVAVGGKFVMSNIPESVVESDFAVEVDVTFNVNGADETNGVSFLYPNDISGWDILSIQNSSNGSDFSTAEVTTSVGKTVVGTVTKGNSCKVLLKFDAETKYTIIYLYDEVAGRYVYVAEEKAKAFYTVLVAKATHEKGGKLVSLTFANLEKIHLNSFKMYQTNDASLVGEYPIYYAADFTQWSAWTAPVYRSNSNSAWTEISAVSSSFGKSHGNTTVLAAETGLVVGGTGTAVGDSNSGALRFRPSFYDSQSNTKGANQNAQYTALGAYAKTNYVFEVTFKTTALASGTIFEVRNRMATDLGIGITANNDGTVSVKGLKATCDYVSDFVTVKVLVDVQNNAIELYVNGEKMAYGDGLTDTDMAKWVAASKTTNIASDFTGTLNDGDAYISGFHLGAVAGTTYQSVKIYYTDAVAVDPYYDANLKVDETAIRLYDNIAVAFRMPYNKYELAEGTYPTLKVTIDEVTTDITYDESAAKNGYVGYFMMTAIGNSTTDTTRAAYHVFQTPRMSASKIDSTITYQLVITKPDGKEYYGPEATISVLDYCKEVYQTTTSEKEKKLVASIVNLGQAIKAYSNEATIDDSFLDSADKVYSYDFSTMATTSKYSAGSDETAKHFTGKAAINITTGNLYVEAYLPAGSNFRVFAMDADGNKLTYPDSNTTLWCNGTGNVEITTRDTGAASALDFKKQLRLKVENTFEIGVNESYIDVSIENVLATIYNDANATDAAKNYAMAMMAYSEAAREYFIAG